MIQQKVDSSKYFAVHFNRISFFGGGSFDTWGGAMVKLFSSTTSINGQFFQTLTKANNVFSAVEYKTMFFTSPHNILSS